MVRVPEVLAQLLCLIRRRPLLLPEVLEAHLS